MLNNQIVTEIVGKVADYSNSEAHKITTRRVERWVNQFDAADRNFILEELNHLLDDCYISEDYARKFLGSVVIKMSQHFKEQDINTLLDNTLFVRCQAETKSQSALLLILDEELRSKYGRTLDSCGTTSHKYVVYIDDVLATGGTLFKDLNKVLDNGDYVIGSDQQLAIFYIVTHSWGSNNAKFRINKARGLRITGSIYHLRNVENNPNLYGQKHNHVYPMNSTTEAEDFLDDLNDNNTSEWPMTNRKHAYRTTSKPPSESFFTSPANRDRYETIMLEKGLFIINNSESLKPNMRPLGVINPSYSTLGVGTHYFTWRNISNTCPLVFWWGNSSNTIWHPLFPQANRGSDD